MKHPTRTRAAVFAGGLTVALAISGCAAGSAPDSTSDGQLSGTRPDHVGHAHHRHQGTPARGGRLERRPSGREGHDDRPGRRPADQQRQLLIQNAQTESDEYTVVLLDVVWTAEFAANRWVTELEPEPLPDRRDA